MTIHPNPPDYPSSKASERHDLRTHLTVIKGYTQLAHRQALRIDGAPPSLVAHLECALSQIERLVLRFVEVETAEPIPPEHEPDEPT